MVQVSVRGAARGQGYEGVLLIFTKAAAPRRGAAFLAVLIDDLTFLICFLLFSCFYINQIRTVKKVYSE